jgi:hypothetical protein
VVFPVSVQQGSLVLGKVPANATVRYGTRALRPTNYGTVVLGIGRDEAGPVDVEITTADGRTQTARIAVTPRDWPVENVRGVHRASGERLGGRQRQLLADPNRRLAMVMGDSASIAALAGECILLVSAGAQAAALPHVLSLAVLADNDPVQVTRLAVPKRGLCTPQHSSWADIGVLLERLADGQTKSPEGDVVGHRRGPAINDAKETK